ncbi:MAG: hypothetical protein CM15mP49_25680 [Actinomycetota bacterium]|nr:MAG: hypothetical protein CM15mP49_25680 [Actinomycetota bacterium]
MGSISAIRELHKKRVHQSNICIPSRAKPSSTYQRPQDVALYAVFVELDIPIFCCAGKPGPRVPFEAQHVKLIDDVMYDFPDLRFVTRHGCEPWEDLAVKLMLKWPNLHYSTSAFAPKYYPEAIINYANTRGAEKILRRFFPMGLKYRYHI